MNSNVPSNNASQYRGTSPRQQDFTTYKDFTSDKSLESADFQESFGEVDQSFYSSSDEQANDILVKLQPKESICPARVSKNKEEETNYTAKPVMIIEKEEIKKTVWCGNCVFRSGSESNCEAF